MKKKFSFIIISILSLSLLFLGCSKKLQHSDIAHFSDKVLSDTLTALSNNDYDNFYTNLSDSMAETFTLPTFQKEAAILVTTVGTLQSLEYDTGEIRGDYYFAIYNGKFSHSDEIVRISAAFKKDDESHKIYELYLYSDELEKANIPN